MAYPEDLVGKFIGYSIDPGASEPSDAVAALINKDIVAGGQVTPASVKVYDNNPPKIGAPFPLAPGQLVYNQVGIPWSFNFLKYVAGATTVAPLNTAVMTGPMTGCYLFTYNDGAVPYLAHVGTYLKPDSENSIAAKYAWRSFNKLVRVSSVVGASPADYFSFNELSSAQSKPGLSAGTATVVGYFSAGRAYAMALVAVAASTRPPGPMMKVVGVKTMTMKPWDAIARLPTFQ